MKILTASQMARVDRLTTEIYRIPALLLMEHAGRTVADEAEKACPGLAAGRVEVLCGKGNNGGDGLVAARHLALRGCRPRVWLMADPGELRGETRANWEMIEALGLDLRHSIAPAQAARVLSRLAPPALVIDALFGTGLSKPLSGGYRALVEWVNRLPEETFVLSVDIPSGLFADAPGVAGAAIQADLTVTFTAPKMALVMHPAAALAGRLVVARIGSPDLLVESDEHAMALVDPAQVVRAIPRRRSESHKGHYGHLFVLAGSRGKSGAALMTGLAALRSGAGLVTLFLPSGLHRDAVGRVPEVMTEWVPETNAGTADISALKTILAALGEAHALVIGPGLTQHESTMELVRLLTRKSPVPVVLDADGLNAFRGCPSEIGNENNLPVVLTPHPGEMARLAGTTVSAVQKSRMSTALEFARSRSCYLVLKGFQTLLATPRGRLLVNPTGNPGMATGGTGDILAGMTGRFVAGWFRRFQGADENALTDHVAAAIYLHGLAGDLAAAELGQESLVATDLLPRLPAAFRQVRSDAEKI